MHKNVATLRATGVSRSHGDDLRLRRTAAIVLQDLMPVDVVRNLRSAVLDLPMDTYRGSDKSGTQVGKRKFGPNQYRFGTDLETYFAAVRTSQAQFEALFETCGMGPVAPVMAALSTAFGTGDVAIADEDGEPYAACVLRDLREAPLHRDFLPADAPYLRLSRTVKQQFAWNLHLAVPSVGGFSRPPADTHSGSRGRPRALRVWSRASRHLHLPGRAFNTAAFDHSATSPGRKR